jgi:hypothetical protein
MHELLSWISDNPKMTLGMLTIICATIVVCVYAVCEHKYGERW